MPEKARTAIICVLIFLMAYPSIRKSLYLDLLLLKPDTRTTAAQWIEQNIPNGESMVLEHPFFSPHITRTSEQLSEMMQRIAPEDAHAGAKREKIRFLMRVAEKSSKTYRLFYLDEKGLSETPFSLWWPLLGPDTHEIKKAGVHYYLRYRYPGESDFFEKKFKRQSELLAVFSPYKSKTKVWTEDHWANASLPFLSSELFSRKNIGPYLEIYRLGNADV